MAQPPQSGEGEVRAKTNYGPCVTGAALRRRRLPKGGESGGRKPGRSAVQLGMALERALGTIPLRWQHDRAVRVARDS